MSLVARARKATGLDIESFSKALGVSWQEIQRFEQGRALENPYQEALFQIIARSPREAMDALAKAKETGVDLGRTIIQLLMELGKGPKKTLPIAEVRKELRFGRNGFGVGNVSPELFKSTMLDLDRLGHVVLQPAVDLANVSKIERDGAIRDKDRGFLVYASPGPKALRTASRGAGRPPRPSS